MRQPFLLLWGLACTVLCSRNPPRPSEPSTPASLPKEVDAAPGIEVHQKDGVMRITKHRRPSGLNATKCCWESFTVAWDATNTPIVVTADNFLCDPESMVQEAIGFDEQKRWQPADIHPDLEYKGDDPLEVTLLLPIDALQLSLDEQRLRPPAGEVARQRLPRAPRPRGPP